jgi:hypothetical protein
MRPYLAVLSSQKNGRALATSLHLYDLIDGAYVCGTQLSIDGAGDGIANNPTGHTTFLTALSDAADRITRKLRVDYNSSTGEVD